MDLRVVDCFFRINARPLGFSMVFCEDAISTFMTSHPDFAKSYQHMTYNKISSLPPAPASIDYHSSTSTVEVHDLLQRKSNDDRLLQRALCLLR